MSVSERTNSRDPVREDGAELLRQRLVGGRTLDDVCAEYVERWSGICRADTRPVNQARVRSLCAEINAHYERSSRDCAALKPPLVLFFPSPEAVFGFWLALFGGDERQRSWWRERCGPATAEAIQQALDTVARALGCARYSDSVEIRDRVEYLVYYSTGYTASPAFWDLFHTGRLSERSHSSLFGTRLCKTWRLPGEERLFQALNDRVRLPVVDALNAAWYAQYAWAALAVRGGQYFGKLDGMWVSSMYLADMCLWELACEALGMTPPDEGDGMVYSLSCWLARESWIVYAFPGVVLVSERPVEMHLDDAGLPHCENGPAVRFADGTGLWLHHGMPMSEALGRLSAGEWEPWMVLREMNGNVRRVLIARVGMDALLRRADAHVLVERGEYAVVSCAVGGVWGRHVFIVDRVRNDVIAADYICPLHEASSPAEVLERFVAEYGGTAAKSLRYWETLYDPFSEWYVCVAGEDELQ